MLRYRSDWQTVAYMVAASALLVLQWHLESFNPVLYGLTLALAFAISIMHHNHCHLAMWKSARLNRVTDYWYTLFQGHPGFVFELFHGHNHHRHCNGPDDYTRTYRNRDVNSLLGLAVHPCQSAATLFPLGMAHLRTLRREDSQRWCIVISHYAFLFTCVGILALIDWQKTIVFVIGPQLFSLYWLLGANYLQHAHTDETTPSRSSRNFLGLVNTLCFNIGLHSAHHANGQLHWSKLPALHETLVPELDPRTIERSLSWYCLRVFVLAAVWPPYRSRSLRQQSR